MSSSLSISVPLCCLLALAGCVAQPAAIEVAADPHANPWSHLRVNDQPEQFHFAIVSDRTGGHRPGVFPTALGKLNPLQPAFVMSVGDLIEGYTEDEAQLDKEWDEIDGFVAQLEMPFFYVPGNHDISNEVMLKKWNERMGRHYYHFLYRDVLFLVLYTGGDETSVITPDQIKYAQQVLKDNPEVRWTFVFMHKPLWEYTDEDAKDTHWDEVEALLQGRPYTVFTGHFHQYKKAKRHDHDYYILATTGGGSGLTGAPFGQFDHIAWVTMTDAGPVVTNIGLEGLYPDTVRTEQSAEWIDPLRDNMKLYYEPMLVDGSTVGELKTQIRLSNQADLPMQVKGSFDAHAQVRPDPWALDVVVEPKSEKVIPLTITTEKPILFQNFQPLIMHATFHYEPKEGPALETTQKLTFGVERRLTVPKSDAPVVLDGKLDDWDAAKLIACDKPALIRLGKDAWKGKDDCRFRFGLKRDDRFVYLMIETFDDKVVLREDSKEWPQDMVEIRLDAREAYARRALGRGLSEYLLGFMVTPGESLEKPGLTMIYREEPPEGMQTVCVKTDTGLVVESAIPVAFLDRIQGKPWESFRLHVIVDDYDGEEDSGSQLWWRPLWMGNDSFPGSGMFLRGD